MKTFLCKVFCVSQIVLSTMVSNAQNLFPSDSWTISSGSIGGFTANGTAAMNIREMGVNPFGEQAILWKAVPDAANSSDGGWDGAFFNIDRTRMYRFSIWIKKTNSQDGYTYLGCNGDDILALNGAVDTNPYFFVGDLPSLNKWYLIVGYIHASTDPSTSNYGGVYDGDTGLKVAPTTDFKFSSTATQTRHRAYLYYDVTTSDRQYFYDPQVYQVKGTLPLVEAPLSGFSNGDLLVNRNVGIGTTSPSGILHVHSSSPSIYITGNSAALRGNQATWLFGYQGTLGSEDISIGTQDNTGSRTLTFAAGGSARMKISSSGNVGIGTLNPTQKLTVNGTIYGKEVKVDLSVPGPDYVFDKDYKLTSLEDIKTYIDQHKHLPEVPSAAVMEANGINLSEMNMILLKKVEELTLYLIEQNKIISEQNDRISSLENKR